MADTQTPEQPPETRNVLPLGQGLLELSANGARKPPYQTLALLAPHGSTEQLPATNIADTQPAAPVYDPHAKMDLAEYRQFIRDMNERIAASPAKGNVHIFDLSVHEKPEQIIQALDGLFEHKSPEVRLDISQTISKALEDGHELKSIKMSGSFSNPENPNYVAVAFPAYPNETSWDLISFNLADNGLAVSEKWAQNLSTPFVHRMTIAHETYHALNGNFYNPLEMSSVNNTKHQETSADIFAAMYLAQQNEPDLESQVLAFAQRRDGDSLAQGAASPILCHNSADALRQLVSDLPKLRADPYFANSSLVDLSKLADKYASTVINYKYQHIAAAYGDDGVEPFVARAEIDRNLERAAYHASMRLLRPDEDHQLSALDPQQATLLLNLSASANAISGNGNNRLVEGILQLREKFPQAFKESEAQMVVPPQSDPSAHKQFSGDPLDRRPRPSILSP